jgi:hypothetical protein
MAAACSELGKPLSVVTEEESGHIATVLPYQKQNAYSSDVQILRYFRVNGHTNIFVWV